MSADSVANELGRIAVDVDVVQVQRHGRGSEAFGIAGPPLLIRMAEIEQVVFKNANFLLRGYVAIQRIGERAVSGRLGSVKSRFAVPFGLHEEELFRQFYVRLQAAVQQHKEAALLLETPASQPAVGLVIKIPSDPGTGTHLRLDVASYVARYSDDLIRNDDVQQVFGGSLVVAVRAPLGWRHEPATREQELKDRILAIYYRQEIAISSLHFYVTIIPKELRDPMTLDEEILADRQMSGRSGLESAGTERFVTNYGEHAAVASWQGEGFVRSVGILTCELGVVLIPGISRDPEHSNLLRDAVKEAIQCAMVLRGTRVDDRRD